MFAVIRTGGKQYRVTPNAVLKVEKLEAEPGATVTFTDVLALGTGSGLTLGSPVVAGRRGHRDGDCAGPAGQGHHLQEASPAEQPPQERPPPACHRAARRRLRQGWRDAGGPGTGRRDAAMAPAADGARPPVAPVSDRRCRPTWRTATTRPTSRPRRHCRPRWNPARPVPTPPKGMGSFTAKPKLAGRRRRTQTCRSAVRRSGADAPAWTEAPVDPSRRGARRPPDPLRRRTGNAGRGGTRRGRRRAAEAHRDRRTAKPPTPPAAADAPGTAPAETPAHVPGSDPDAHPQE